MEWILILVVFLLDQASKYYIQFQPSLHGMIEILPNFFYITYVKNTGAAWSMLSGQQAFLSVLAAIAIGGMLYVLFLEKKPKSKLVRIALCFMIAGAAGNLYDRLVIGAVRDFLDFYIFGYDFPVFNIADSALSIGIVLLFLDSWILNKREQ